VKGPRVGEGVYGASYQYWHWVRDRYWRPGRMPILVWGAVDPLTPLAAPPAVPDARSLRR